MRDIFVVQRYRNDVWQTVAASTYEGDAEESYAILDKHSLDKAPLRQCRLQVTDLDFLMIYARDVEVQRTSS